MTQLLMLHPDLSEFADAQTLGVRSLAYADATSLGRLLDEAFDEHTWTNERVRAELIEASDIVDVYGVVEHDTVVATASARRDELKFPGQGYLHMVATGSSARGRGLGRAVTRAVLARFAAEGLSEAVLETDDGRTSALRLYLALGFVPVARDHTHYRRWSTILKELYQPVPSAPTAHSKDPR